MPNPTELETRLAELEIENAWQRETIETLNQSVTEQWGETERIAKMLEQILDHMRLQNPGADGGGASGGNEPPPPHY